MDDLGIRMWCVGWCDALGQGSLERDVAPWIAGTRARLSEGEFFALSVACTGQSAHFALSLLHPQGARRKSAFYALTRAVCWRVSRLALPGRAGPPVFHLLGCNASYLGSSLSRCMPLW